MKKKLKLFGLAPRKDQTRLYALIKILNGRIARLRFQVFGSALIVKKGRRRGTKRKFIR